jgi:hypothetical protein
MRDKIFHYTTGFENVDMLCPKIFNTLNQKKSHEIFHSGVNLQKCLERIYQFKCFNDFISCVL